MIRLKADNEGFGRIRATLYRGPDAIGVATISETEYRETWKQILIFAREQAKQAIIENLGEMLWHDARSGAELSDDQAKQKLLDFGWTQQKIDQYAENLAVRIAQKIAENLPGR